MLENASNILGPQGANPVGLRRTSQEALLEGGFLGRRQLAGAARLLLGDDRLQPVIAIGVHPQLHEPAATGQGPCDLGSTVALQGQHHGAIAVALFGVPLLLAALPQLFQIVRMTRCDLHGQFLPFLREYATGRPRALPYFNRRARIFPNPYQLVEVTPDKKVVWVLWDWVDLGPATAVQILDDPGIPENPGESEH